MDTVIFDIGQVIINWQPHRAFEPVLAPEEIPGFLERIGFAEWNAANDLLADTSESFNELVSRFPADEDAIRAYQRNYHLTITQAVPGTAAVIAELQHSGVTIGALTNWEGGTFPVAQQMHGVLGRFADIVVSGYEGVMKPDAAIFDLACQRLGSTPADSVFIDDSPRNVAGAEAFGMTGLLFTSAEKLRADLVELGLLGERPQVTQPFYHLASRQDWDAALSVGHYPWSTKGMEFNRAGFVHGSFPHQVADIRAGLFGDLADSELVWLRLDPNAELPILIEDGYPHLFAPLPLELVQESAPL